MLDKVSNEDRTSRFLLVLGGGGGGTATRASAHSISQRIRLLEQRHCAFFQQTIGLPRYVWSILCPRLKMATQTSLPSNASYSATERCYVTHHLHDWA